MSHHLFNASDAEIDTVRVRRGNRLGTFALLLLFLSIGGAVVAQFASSDMIGNVAGTIAVLSFLCMGLTTLFFNECDLRLLEDDVRLMEETLELFKRSPAARQRRDEILASGRSLRKFDVIEFRRVHLEALHRQKVQRLNGIEA